MARRRWRGRFATALVAFFGSLLLAEIAIRGLGVEVPPSLYRLDPDVGDTLAPGAEGWWTREGRAYVRISSQGLRDEEHAIPKPLGTIRIVLLGDSFAEALQVDQRETFWSILERDLASCPVLAGRPVEVVNLGVSGYGTDDAIDVLRRYGPSLEPDLVLLFFCVANDFENNLFDGRCRRDGAGVVCDPPARPTTRQLAFAHAKSWLSSHSELYQALQASATSPWWQRLGLRAAVPLAVATAKPFGPELFVVPPSPRVASAIDLTGGLLRTLRDAASELGAPLWLVILPTREQVEDEAWTRFAGDAPGAVRDEPERALTAIAAPLDIPVIDPLPALRSRAAAGDRAYWRIDAHFTAVGHATTARLVADVLLASEGRPR